MPGNSYLPSVGMNKADMGTTLADGRETETLESFGDLLGFELANFEHKTRARSQL